MLKFSDFLNFGEDQRGLVGPRRVAPQAKTACNIEQINAGIRLWRTHSAALENWGGEDRATAFYQMADERCPMTIQILDDREGKPAQHF